MASDTVERHLTPFFGDMKLAAIRRTVWYAHLSQAHLSAADARLDGVLTLAPAIEETPPPNRREIARFKSGNCYQFGTSQDVGTSLWLVSWLFCWRPRRDLNPCYRRERAYLGI